MNSSDFFSSRKIPAGNINAFNFFNHAYNVNDGINNVKIRNSRLDNIIVGTSIVVTTLSMIIGIGMTRKVLVVATVVIIKMIIIF